jgi:hypothetical protein
MKGELEAAKLERYAPIERTNVHPVVKELFLCEMKNVSKKNVVRYSDTVKEFCSSLYKVNCKLLQSVLQDDYFLVIFDASIMLKSDLSLIPDLGNQVKFVQVGEKSHS